jgi:hypothetical protein
MRVFKAPIVACWVMLAVGCMKSSDPGNGGPSGPGRFLHSAIRQTIAPWDGPAVELILSEKPLNEKRRVAPYLTIRLHRSPDSFSNRRVHLQGERLREGGAQWVEEGGKGTTLPRVEVTFQEVRKGDPVQGTYEVEMPDGTRERGRFQAVWWAPEGPGG